MRRLLLAAAFLPLPIAIAVAATAPGCASEFEDICGFLKDPNGCYRSFHVETGDRCGAIGVGNGPKGTFASREVLDVCFLDSGGQVIFDPPLDLTTFPLKSAAFTRKDAQAEVCGSAKFDGQFSYALTVDRCSQTEEDAGVPKCADVGGTRAPADVTGGTVTINTPSGRDVYDVTCADGASHHFNRLDVEKCEEHAQLLPTAELDSDPGTQPGPNADPANIGDEFNGFVRFRVFYPPVTSTLDAEGIAANTAPEVVEYFDCKIPAPSPLCANGKKDGTETDVDCGGLICASRCAQGQSCIKNEDCGEGGTCALDKDKFLKCQ